ncbi:uncharacterized protein F5147DRAFT_781170 [Suillus discolor]|uniref:Uncharacterized protein n=1 Tax=Suillus discolor TaxID=1912936 RepID=A0A9P7ETR2_9AGAM|nr:uncharacterized protein F5147DRAFT_781170 [Suillus discolor]KAG2087905.1 hypothetical protein F5147DRAFT_781170 [Suillus discolor]
MHPCLTPPPSSTRGSSPDHHVDNSEARGRPMTQTLRRTRDFSPTKPIKRHRSLSPSSSNTEDDDINAPASLPPIISYLSFVVKRAKAKHSDNPSGYWRRPRMLELRFAERYIGPSDMVPVDVERGKSLVEHGLRNMSSEAVAQAVLTKEADLEWKRLRALASAWEIEILLEDEAACLANASKEPLAISLESLANYSMEELKTRTAFSIAAYSQDRTSFIATDAQLDHLEFLAHEHYLPTSDEDTFEVSARGQESQAGDEGRLPASPTNSDASAMLLLQ